MCDEDLPITNLMEGGAVAIGKEESRGSLSSSWLDLRGDFAANQGQTKRAAKGKKSKTTHSTGDETRD